MKKKKNLQLVGSHVQKYENPFEGKKRTKRKETKKKKGGREGGWGKRRKKEEEEEGNGVFFPAYSNT